MKLYEFSISRSIRARWMLAEVGAHFEPVEVDLQSGGGQTDDYLKINPMGKVPALVDGDFAIWESSAIINYLAEKFPEKNLIPKSGTFERGRYDQWMFYTLTELDAVLWTKAKNSFIYPEEFKTPEVNKGCAYEFKKNVRIIEEHLAGREYVLDHFSGVDVALGHTLLWAGKVEDYLDNCPNCQAYVQRVMARKNFPSDMYND